MDLKVIRKSNGKIYKVIEEKENLYLIDRGVIIGQVYEDKSKFDIIKN